MKKLKYVYIIVAYVFNFVMTVPTVHTVTKEQAKTSDSLSFKTSVKAKKTVAQAIKCLMANINPSEQLKRIANVIKFDLAFTDQIDVTLKEESKAFRDKDLKQLFDQDISLYLSLEQKKDGLRVILKDTSGAGTAFKKTYAMSGHPVVVGHTVSNDLIPVLTGEPGVAMITLAYSKQVSPQQKIICISDYAGMVEIPSVTTKALNVAPSWHSRAPYLFYSQFLPTHSSLMSYNLASGRHKTVCSYEGLNMQPSFSKDGRQVALCLSAQGKNSEIFLYDQQLCNQVGHRTFRQLTSNRGNNASPRLLPNGDVIFCSDFESRSPQLYYLDRKEDKVTRLSNGLAYYAAPAFNEKMNSIVYTRFIKGNFQLFMMNLKEGRKSEQQLTFGQSDKLDPVWSNCGRYVFFTLDHETKETGRRVPQIAVFNRLSKKVRVLTQGSSMKGFSAWTDQSYYQMRLA